MWVQICRAVVPCKYGCGCGFRFAEQLSLANMAADMAADVALGKPLRMQGPENPGLPGLTRVWTEHEDGPN
jgi:hypothetical protein